MNSKWIDATKRRPKQGTLVLFCSPSYCPSACYGYYRGGWWYDQGLDYFDEEKKRVGWPVTYWMPLPALPAEQ